MGSYDEELKGLKINYETYAFNDIMLYGKR